MWRWRQELEFLQARASTGIALVAQPCPWTFKQHEDQGGSSLSLQYLVLLLSASSFKGRIEIALTECFQRLKHCLLGGFHFLHSNSSMSQHVGNLFFFFFALLQQSYARELKQEKPPCEQNSTPGRLWNPCQMWSWTWSSNIGLLWLSSTSEKNSRVYPHLPT